MGWFQRVFSNSADAKIERAERFISQERYNDVRLELMGLEQPKAKELLAHALTELIELNLAEAAARYNSGDYSGAQEHLELARQFGASPQEIRETRGRGTQLQQERKRQAQAEKAKSAEFKSVGDDPIWSLPPNDPRLKYAVHLEGYPVELREKLIALGQEFAMAVLSIDEGQGRAAMDTLSHFTEQEPAARFERARAALSVGQLEVGCSELMLFGQEAEHCSINNTHTGALLSQLLLQLGRLEDGLRNAEELLKTDQNPSLNMVRISLLENSERLDEAEHYALNMLKEHPTALPVVRQLASIQVKQDKRIDAANLIESSLERCCSPGKCSSQPLDIGLLRLLARIYLEDRVLPDRSAELLQQIQGLAKRPSWDDLYLTTLNARNQADPFLAEKISMLRAQLKPQDQRISIIEKAFG